MKRRKTGVRVVSMLLMVAMLFSLVPAGVAAQVNDIVGPVDDTVRPEIKMLDGTVLTQEEFTEFLEQNKDNIIKISDSTSNFAIPEISGVDGETLEASISSGEAVVGVGLIAGTWWIPLFGVVVITVAGAIIVNDVLIPAGSWLWNRIADWFFARAFRRSAREALDNAGPNLRHHIIKGSKRRPHDWSKFTPNPPPSWNEILPYLLLTMQSNKSTETIFNKALNQFELARTFRSGGTVVVRFIKDKDGLVRWISTAYAR